MDKRITAEFLSQLVICPNCKQTVKLADLEHIGIQETLATIAYELAMFNCACKTTLSARLPKDNPICTPKTLKIATRTLLNRLPGISRLVILKSAYKTAKSWFKGQRDMRHDYFIALVYQEAYIANIYNNDKGEE